MEEVTGQLEGLRPVANRVEGVVQIIQTAHCGQAVALPLRRGRSRHQRRGRSRAQAMPFAGIHLPQRQKQAQWRACTRNMATYLTAEGW